MLQVAGCLNGVRIYLLGTVLQGCRLLKGSGNLPTGHCGAVVQAVLQVSEPTSHGLWGRGAGCLSGVGTSLPCTVLQVAGCLSGVGTSLPCTVGQVCRLFKWCWNQPPMHLGQVCRLFKRCWNLPPMHCGAGVQAV